MNTQKHLVALAAAAGLWAAAGCSVLPETQPDRTRFYVLTSPAASGAAVAAAAPTRVVLRVVSLPEFLRNRIMPVRVGDNELRFVDEARWAEPLESALTRVLGDGLASAPGVRVLERRGEPHDYEVTVRVSHCEGVLPAGVARVSAHLEIYAADLEARLVAQEDFTVDVGGWDGRDYSELAKKLSEATGALARRIGGLLPAKEK